MAHPFTKLFAFVLLPMAAVTFQIGASGASLTVTPGVSAATPVDVGASAAPVASDVRQPVVVEEVVIAAAVAPAKRRARPASSRVEHATVVALKIEVAPETNAPAPVVAPVPVVALVDHAVRQQPPKFFAFADEHQASDRTERPAGATTTRPSSTDVLADVEGIRAARAGRRPHAATPRRRPDHQRRGGRRTSSRSRSISSADSPETIVSAQRSDVSVSCATSGAARKRTTCASARGLKRIDRCPLSPTSASSPPRSVSVDAAAG